MFEDEDSDDNESIQWEQEPETLGKGDFLNLLKFMKRKLFNSTHIFRNWDIRDY